MILFFFRVLVRVLSCLFRPAAFLLKMVTTRAMFRQSHKGGSVSSSSSPSNAVLQREAEVNLETELRIAADSFPPSPRPVFRADEIWSTLRMNASYGPPGGTSAGDINSSAIPRPRSHLRDPRLKAAMAKVLARVDGGSAHRVSVFKARAPPLTTAIVASILHKVDNDLRKIPEGQEVSSVGTGPSPGTRFEWKMGLRSDWFEPEKGVVTLQDQKCPFPLFDALPRSSSFVDDDNDYDPDDRDPDSLPPLSVRETERYAYLEDDFDAYLGKTMASTTFFPTGTPEEWTLQIYVSGPWNHLASMTFAIITVFVRPGILLDELHDRLDPISAIDRFDRVLSLGSGRLLQPFTPLSTQGGGFPMRDSRPRATAWRIFGWERGRQYGDNLGRRPGSGRRPRRIGRYGEHFTFFGICSAKIWKRIFSCTCFADRPRSTSWDATTP